jgi:hypothetical protein
MTFVKSALLQDTLLINQRKIDNNAIGFMNKCIFEKLLTSFFKIEVKKKKNKNVKFSGINQVYLIYTIDEIKEYLPDMYWNFDTKKNINTNFIPLRRNEFVYELNPHYDGLKVTKNVINTEIVRKKRPDIY